MADAGRVLRAAGPWVGLWVLILAPRLLALSREPFDSRPVELERTALCLAERGFLGDPYPGHGGPSAHVSPVWPAVVAAVYATFGSGLTGHRVQSALTILAVGAGIALLPRLARALVGTAGPGWAAAVLMSVLPFSIGYIQVRGEWEQPLSFLIVSLYLPHLLAAQREGWRGVRLWAGVGAATGVYVLVNPQFGLVFALAGVWGVLTRADRWAVLPRVAGAAVVAALVVAPWTARNYVALGGWCPVRSNAGLELAFGNNDRANGKSGFTWWGDKDSPLYTLHPNGSPAEVAKLRAVGELAYMAGRQAEASDWIRAHPARFAELCVVRLRLFWFPPPDLWTPVVPEAARQVRSAMHCGVTALMLVGLARLLLRDRAAGGVAVAVLVGLSAAYAVTHVDVRYHFPLHGLELVLGTSAVWAAGVGRLVPGGRS